MALFIQISPFNYFIVFVRLRHHQTDCLQMDKIGACTVIGIPTRDQFQSIPVPAAFVCVPITGKWLTNDILMGVLVMEECVGNLSSLAAKIEAGPMGRWAGQRVVVGWC